MTRRLRTLVVGCALLLALVALVFALPVPYVILSPGETFNTLGNVPGRTTPIITVTGKKANATTGTLILTTVNETPIGSRFSTRWSVWLQSDRIVVPHDAIVAPGTSEKQQSQQDTAGLRRLARQRHGGGLLRTRLSEGRGHRGLRRPAAKRRTY